MPECPICGHDVKAPFDDAPGPVIQGSCGNCGERLRATFRYPTPVSVVGFMIAALLQVVALPFNPKFSFKKMSGFSHLTQYGAMRLFWRTKLVRVESFTRPELGQHSESKPNLV